MTPPDDLESFGCADILGPMAPGNWTEYHVLIRGEVVEDLTIIHGQITGAWFVRLHPTHDFEATDKANAAWIACVLAEGMAYGARRGNHRSKAHFADPEERPRPQLVQPPKEGA